MQGAGHSTPGNWGRPPIIELGEQRKQRTSLKLWCRLKLLANGYQPRQGVKRGGKAINLLGCPTKTNCRPHYARLPTTKHKPTHKKPTPPATTIKPIFLPFFSKSVSLQKQYIYVYGWGLAAHALVRADCLCVCACVLVFS